MNAQKLDIANLLRSGYGTALPYVDDILQYISDAERHSKRYEDETRRLTEKLSILQMKQKRLKLQIIKCRCLLAPVRRLPPEVLIHIFEFFCPASEIASGISCPAVKLSHVCTLWRSLVRSTPVLWSSLEIQLWSSRLSLERIMLMLDEHLTRSRSSPLYLKVTICKNNNISQSVIAALVSHSNRWKEAYLQLPSDILHGEVFSSIRGNLSSLCTLEIRCDDDFSSDVFCIAPRLQKLKLVQGGLRLKLPWHQIHDHTSRFCSLSTAIQELALASEAKNVTVHRCRTREVPSETCPLIHNLHTLNIVVDKSDSDFCKWFRWLSLPNLTSLKISAWESFLPKSCPAFHDIGSFLSRSSCTIISLSLVDIGLRDADAIALVASIPSLAQLTIHERQGRRQNVTITAHFLRSLRVNHNKATPSRSLLLKHMGTLDLQFHAELQYSELLVDMVESRWIPNPDYSSEIGVVCLNTVKLRIIGNDDTNGLKVHQLYPLTLLKASGLRLSLS